MTRFLIFSLALSLVILVFTLALLLLPASRAELRLWTLLRVSHWRRWITMRRNTEEPLNAPVTLRTARNNLLWHLLFTALFTVQTAQAILEPDLWWRPLVAVLVLPVIAYAVGSIVQRQKISILRIRARTSRSAR